jgi:hypothetical protein
MGGAPPVPRWRDLAAPARRQSMFLDLDLDLDHDLDPDLDLDLDPDLRPRRQARALTETR